MSIERTKLDTLIANCGMTVEEKAAFTKIEGPSGARVYVSKAKTCKQVDLSGFGAGLPGTLAPKAPNGAVQAQMDFTGDEAAILARLQGILDALSVHKAPVKEAKVAAPKRAAAVKEETVSAAAERPPTVRLESRKERAARIADRAKHLASVE